MALFRLPPNSRIRPGRHHDAPAGARNVKTFRIYRFDPDAGENPRMDSFGIDMDDCGPMLLDVLIKIKNEIDSTLTFRRSCREGICGSCAMNIEGVNTLACTLSCTDVGRDVHLSAAAHAGGEGPGAGSHAVLCAVRIRETLAADLARPRRRTGSGCSRKRSRKRSTGPSACILCACCSTTCPSYWWNSDRYLGPAALLAAYRWIIDSRDEATGERLDALEDPFRLYRCHTIMNCTEACPKDLNPAKAIGEIKKLLAERRH